MWCRQDQEIESLAENSLDRIARGLLSLSRMLWPVEAIWDSQPELREVYSTSMNWSSISEQTPQREDRPLITAPIDFLFCQLGIQQPARKRAFILFYRGRGQSKGLTRGRMLNKGLFSPWLHRVFLDKSGWKEGEFLETKYFSQERLNTIQSYYLYIFINLHLKLDWTLIYIFSLANQQVGTQKEKPDQS